MVGLEIVMNLDTLEIFEVIDHDKKWKQRTSTYTHPIKFV